MDEEFVKEHEQKVGEFDIQLAEDTILALQKEVDELVEFVAKQSCNCFESECRKLAIKKMGYKSYLAFIIKEKETETLLDEDWDFIRNLLTN